MKIIIVGGGRLGYAIARQLLLENHDITVIEPDSRRAEFISTSLDVIVLEGRATIELLCEAGAANADLLIAATMSDETNLISCAVGRKLGARHTIARVREEEYYQDMLLLRDEMGLSLSINPERTAAKEISRILRFPVATKVEPFANGLAELVEYHVGAKSKLSSAAASSISRTATMCSRRGMISPSSAARMSSTRSSSASASSRMRCRALCSSAAAASPSGSRWS